MFSLHPWSLPSYPERRLRVGFLSSEFRRHSAAYNFEPFLDCRDRAAFEFFGYSQVAAPDEVTQRFAEKFDTFRNIRLLDDRSAALLERVGLGFFASETEAEYHAKALALAADPSSLARIRASMRTRMTTPGGLCDGSRFMRGVEAALRGAWRQWSAGVTGHGPEQAPYTLTAAALPGTPAAR